MISDTPGGNIVRWRDREISIAQVYTEEWACMQDKNAKCWVKYIHAGHLHYGIASSSYSGGKMKIIMVEKETISKVGNTTSLISWLKEKFILGSICTVWRHKAACEGQTIHFQTIANNGSIRKNGSTSQKPIS